MAAEPKLVCWIGGSAGWEKIQQKLAELKQKYPKTKYTVAGGTGFLPTNGDWSCCQSYRGSYAIFKGDLPIANFFGESTTYYSKGSAFEPSEIVEVLG